MTNRLLVATTNQGKVREIKAVFAAMGLPLKVTYLQGYNVATPDEPYESFMENAIHKAKHYAYETMEVTLSEDSGLCIEAIGGFPGVRTKEFLEECGTKEKAFVKLEQMLEGTSNRKACFRCAVALYNPKDGFLVTCEAELAGLVTFPPRGTKGFGYHPIFVPEGYNQTLAELDGILDNIITPRARAIRSVVLKWHSKGVQL